MTMKRMMLLSLICAVLALPLSATAAKPAPVSATKQVKEKPIPAQVKKVLDALQASIEKQVKEQTKLVEQMTILEEKMTDISENISEDTWNNLVTTPMNPFMLDKGNIKIKSDKINKELSTLANQYHAKLKAGQYKEAIAIMGKVVGKMKEVTAILKQMLTIYQSILVNLENEVKKESTEPTVTEEVYTP